nr:fatty acid amide hydrolase-like [Tanacetum cinerariifolium]
MHVYIDEGFDLFHVLHVEILKNARQLGDFLQVGIYIDQPIRSKITTPSMVAEYIISAIKELSNKEPLMPLLVSFDPEDVRRQAATST